uniref:Uncharacterized protein n=1 Tax=Poecilia latipinna TaxID=48699 RepID=A0A3B3VMF2_9TELE
MFKLLFVGESCKLQPHPPKQRVFGKQGSKKLRILSSGRERVSSGTLYAHISVLYCVFIWLRINYLVISPRSTPTPVETQLRSGLSFDPEVWNSRESNEGSEPQLTLQKEVFTFSSQPHSPKRGQSQVDQEKMDLGDGQAQSTGGGRRQAQPEDDFIGSESDEVRLFLVSHRITNNPLASESPRTNPASPRQDLTNTCMQYPCSGRAEPARMVPARCHSPSRSRHKSGKADQVLGSNISILRTVESSNYASQLQASTRMCEDDDEELQMLASLKRQQDEDECRAPALSASQVHQCDVSISLSSDDNFWKCAVNQGHHYQKEMNPLLQSNPREWMDVLSPPIMPPSQQRRSGNTENNWESLLRGMVTFILNGDEYLKLLYDPCLNCYFDPESGKYYELA